MSYPEHVKTTLQKLEHGRVFSIELSKDGSIAYFGEECDGCFGIQLDHKEMGELIEELLSLHKKMSL